MYTWRGSFIIIGCISFLWVLLWAVYFRDDPRTNPKISREEIAKLPAERLSSMKRGVPFWKLLKRMMPVTATDFCYGLILWLYLNWIPSFFLHQYQLDLKKSALFASGVFFAGVVGDTVGGFVSDYILKKTGRSSIARTSVIIVGFLGSFCFMLPVLYVTDLTTIALCLSAAFFFAELIVAPIWAVPMVCSEFSGTASGFMNFGFGPAGYLPRGVRLHHRPDRTLGLSLRRVTRLPPAGCFPRALHEARRPVRRDGGGRRRPYGSRKTRLLKHIQQPAARSPATL